MAMDRLGVMMLITLLSSTTVFILSYKPQTRVGYRVVEVFGEVYICGFYGKGHKLGSGDLVEYVLKGFSLYSMKFGDAGLTYKVGTYDIYINGKLVAENKTPAACLLPNPLYPRGVDFWTEMKRACEKSSLHLICNVELIDDEAVLKEYLYPPPPTGWTESVGYVEIQTGLLKNYTWHEYEHRSGKLLQSYSLVLVERPELPVKASRFPYPWAKRECLPMLT